MEYIKQIIAQALRLYKSKSYHNVNVIIEPQAIPAFKKITIELYEFPQFNTETNKILFVSSTYKITNEIEEREAMIKSYSKFLHLILEYFSNEAR